MSTRPTRAQGPPLVSVVVPTYNYARFIGETLENLRAQTYGNWECVVVDDGSTDDTAEVVARFAEREPRVRYVRQENQRQSVAKNTGLDATTGEYVQFLDADDFIEPLKFERQVEFMETHADADIVYGGVRFFHTERPGERLHAMFGENKPWMPEVSGSGREILLPLLKQNIMVINAPLLRRSVVEDVGPFDPQLPPVEDWEYWIRCALAGKRFEFRDFEGTLALVRSHGASASRQPVSVLTAWRALRDKIETMSEDPEVLRLNRDMKSQLEAAIGLDDLTAGRRLNAARQFFRAGLLCPRAKGRAKFMLCGLGSPLLSARYVRALMEASL